MNEEIMEMYRTRLAENLPVLRAKLKMTQEDLAAALDVSRHTIIGIEKKLRPMMWTTFLALLYLLSQFDETRVLLDAMGLVPHEYIAWLKDRELEPTSDTVSKA